MAALTDAMNWYSLSGGTTPRLKYLFQVRFYSKAFGDDAKQLFQVVRTVELPKYSLETEILNSWNLRVPISTRIMFEPISITFNDTQDNKFQKFIREYMETISGNFTESISGTRTGFDNKGLNLLDTQKDRIIEKIEIIQFGRIDGNHDLNSNFERASTITLWRPVIVDVQHDTLDYATSEAVTWTISLRYDSVTYDIPENFEG